MIISKRAIFSLKTFWPAFCRTETMVRAMIGRSPAWLFHTIEPRLFSHTSNLRNIQFVLFIRALYFMAVSLFSSLSHCGFGRFPWSSVSSPTLDFHGKTEGGGERKWRGRSGDWEDRVFSQRQGRERKSALRLALRWCNASMLSPLTLHTRVRREVPEYYTQRVEHKRESLGNLGIARIRSKDRGVAYFT